MFSELFLDTEKEFDEVCHDGLLYKIENQLTVPNSSIIDYTGNFQFSVKELLQDQKLYYQEYRRVVFLGRN